MEQLYTEAGCKPNKGAQDWLKVIGMALAAVISAGLLLSGQVILQIIGAVVIVGVIYFFPRLNYEYEYIFCDGQIDFDKIMGGNKRKNLLKIDMDEMELAGPVKATEVASYQNLKTRDFSSKQQNGRVYVLIVRVNNEMIRVLFEPSEKMLELMRRKSPRKVIRY
ncbi:MAG: hypothetical protein PWP24_1819 [Clostridiales bacterium]|nr:hypothetical protein [Clostridiales bacterium]